GVVMARAPGGEGARRDRGEPCQGPEQRALPGAVGTKDAQYFPRCHDDPGLELKVSALHHHVDVETSRIRRHAWPRPVGERHATPPVLSHRSRIPTRTATD